MLIPAAAGRWLPCLPRHVIMCVFHTHSISLHTILIPELLTLAAEGRWLPGRLGHVVRLGAHAGIADSATTGKI